MPPGGHVAEVIAAAGRLEARSRAHVATGMTGPSEHSCDSVISLSLDPSMGVGLTSFSQTSPCLAKAHPSQPDHSRPDPWAAPYRGHLGNVNAAFCAQGAVATTVQLCRQPS